MMKLVPGAECSSRSRYHISEVSAVTGITNTQKTMVAITGHHHPNLKSFMIPLLSMIKAKVAKWLKGFPPGKSESWEVTR